MRFRILSRHFARRTGWSSEPALLHPLCASLEHDLHAPGKMKHCSNCRLDLPDAYTFCTQCGGDLSKIINPLKGDATCPSCGATMKPGWRFCKVCAFEVNDERTVL